LTKWIVLAKHGNFASDVSKTNTEKSAVITTDPEMDNAKMTRVHVRDKSVNATVLLLPPSKPPK